ncbi:transposase [Nonomuraea recticatena]
MDTVALYESRPGAAISGIAADLGISSETLRNWIRATRTERDESCGGRERRAAAAGARAGGRSGTSCARPPGMSPGTRW